MTDPKEQAKIAKKSAKAAAKTLKKTGAGGAATGSDRHESALRELAAASSAHSGGGTGTTPTPSPAERSAAAAERQVRYTRVRMWVGVLTLIATIVTILLTVDPFGWW